MSEPEVLDMFADEVAQIVAVTIIEDRIKHGILPESPAVVPQPSPAHVAEARAWAQACLLYLEAKGYTVNIGGRTIDACGSIHATEEGGLEARRLLCQQCPDAGDCDNEIHCN